MGSLHRLSAPGLRLLVLAVAGIASACTAGESTGDPGTSVPPAPPSEWTGVIGEYAQGADTLSVLEDEGTLYLLPWNGVRQTLTSSGDGSYEVDGAQTVVARLPGEELRLRSMALGERVFPRIHLGGEGGGTFQITSVRPPEELRSEALAAIPPEEEGDFLPSELVELVSLDPTIKLDIRYAGTNNFLGERFYSSPRAFLQRPAAEAVVRASAWLRERGYGLLVHDGYRPWYVTKMFWDATPESLKAFVADPANGSRHNRGCAVDLTLYDLETGEAVTMPGGYDEMSPRSFADYQGGTTRPRWLRDLLREAMEAQGFSVYEAEWWHYDHEDWRRYRIGNQRFEEIDVGY